MPLPTHFTLNTGAKIPAVGFGTWQAPPDAIEAAVKTALEAGYRHIDCAAIYRNEAGVGAGIRASGVSRGDIFITGKLWNTRHRPEDVEPALDETLRDLETDYLDLYLMHWPVAFKSGSNNFPIDSEGIFQLEDIDPATTYAAMEKLLSTGKVRAIGVSNFPVTQIESLLAKTSVVPAANQVEAHPYLQQPALLSYCQSKGIQLAAYSPLGNNQTGEPKTVDDPLVAQLSEKTGIDKGQLLYSWGVQRGTVVLPKSVTPSRIEGNLKVRELEGDVYGALSGLERNKRYNWQERWGFDIYGVLGEEKTKELARASAKENLEKWG